MIFDDHDTIVAPATPAGGALCLVRLSGERAIELCDCLFQGRRPLSEAATATAHYGYIMDGKEVVDDVVVTLYKAPRSYTGEDTVEISTHGSRYIVERVLALFVKAGARMAEPGEFTRRAFLAGRMDLSQAEAVADIISADSRAAYAVASTQMRGGYSAALADLRERLVKIMSLLELELDFSEEDVEFADRTELNNLLNDLRDTVGSLCHSFSLGNALKHGVTVAIAGRPNVGKSTLLNAFAGEDRAMVSAIAGTTRDTVEVVKNLGGVNFRFIDTAGLHESADELERMGIERTTEAMRRAMIILWLTDDENSSITQDLAGYEPAEDQKVYRVLTKNDLKEFESGVESAIPTIAISAKTGAGMDALQQCLASAADATAAYAGDVIVSNRRHYDALCQAEEALTAAINGLQMGTPTDLLSEDIRQVVHHIGLITGEISSNDILHSIFANFCIGK